MSEHDPLLVLGGLIDESVAPRTAFSEALRAQLLAELGTNGQPKEKEPHMMNLAAPGTIARLPERVKRTRRQRLMTAFEIAAVAAIMIGVIAALSPDRWGRSDSPTPSSNSIQAIVPSASASPEASPVSNTSLLWRRAPDGASDSSVIALTSGGGNVFQFVQLEHGFTGVQAFDGNTGEPGWQFPITVSWGGSGVTYGDGRVFVYGATSLDDRGQPKWELYALDGTTGDVQWAVGIPNYASPPSYADGVVYIMDTFHTMTALNAEDGSEVWTQIFQHVITMFSVNEGRIYFWSLPSDRIESFPIDDPSNVETIALGSTGYSLNPVVIDGLLIVVSSPSHWGSGISGTGTMTAFDTSNHFSQVWKKEYQREIGTPVVSNDALIASIPTQTDSTDFSARNSLARIDARSGDTIWQSSVSSAGFGVLSTTTNPTDLVIAPSAEGILYGIDPNTGNLIWAVSDMHVSLLTIDGNGHIYASLYDGSLAALQPIPGSGAGITKPSDQTVTAGLPDGVSWERPFAVGHVRQSNSVVANGVVVRTIRSNVFTGIQGLSAASGQLLWQQELRWSAELASDDTLAYIPLQAGEGVMAINPHSGEIVWRTKLVGSMGAPAIRDGVIYLWSSSDMVFALDAKTGAILWQAYMPPSSAAPFVWGSYFFKQPAIGDNIVVSISSSGNLNAFDRASGEQAWSLDGFDAPNTHYVASSNLLVVLKNSSPDSIDSASTQLTIEGIDLATGKAIWQANGWGTLNQIPVITTDPNTGDATVSLIAQEIQSADQVGTPFAIPASNTGIVFMLDVQTGEVVQQSHGTNYTAIASTDDGTGLLLGPLTSRSTNAPLDLGQPIDGVPVNAGETIFVTLTDGTLVAIDGTKLTAT